MKRIKSARRIRDLVLAEAGLTLEASLELGHGSQSVATQSWRARLRRVSHKHASPPGIDAIKLDLWVEDKKVAVMSWTRDDFRVVQLTRGAWETRYFNQIPYRTSAERWVEICNRTPADISVLGLMRQIGRRPAAVQSARQPDVCSDHGHAMSHVELRQTG